MRVVIDPNVFVSSVIKPDGVSAGVVRAGFGGKVEVVICPALVAELDDVLNRPKLRNFITAEEARVFIDALVGVAVAVADPGGDPVGLRDPDDEYLVALAASSGAEIIVSGDKDLLEIDLHVEVVGPAEFLGRIA